MSNRTPKPLPRIGVFVCHCGTNISATVDVDKVAEYAAGLPGVVFTQTNKYTCSDPGQEQIRRAIVEQKLDRVVIAACSPRMHEHTFQRALRDTGMNPYFLQVANIREHVSWVHQDRTEATEKAKELVAASVERVPLHEALESRQVSILPSALVVGAGIAGIQAALDIANGGFQVHLVEKEPTIGGNMAKLDKTFPTLDCAACILSPKMVDAGRHENIHLYSYSEVVSVEGHVGQFKVRIKRKPRYVREDICTGCGLCTQACVWQGKISSEFEAGMGTRSAAYIPFPQAVPLKAIIDSENCLYLKRGKCSRKCEKACGPGAIDFKMQEEIVEIEVGTIILATGFDLYDMAELPQYGYGVYDNVLDGLQFERLCNASGPTGGRVLTKDGRVPESIAFLHCIGSRDENTNAYCSQLCCMHNLKLAHLAQEKTHGDVYQFYIDIRAGGKGYEEFYKRVQQEGVHFIRGKGTEIIPEGDKLLVRSEDTFLGRIVEAPVDMVVLAIGLVPPKNIADIARTFNVNRSRDGFFMEAHPKLRPAETNVEGVFLAGSCQGPKDIPATVAHASAAAAQALSMMSRGKTEIEPLTAEVIAERCSSCGECIVACPFKAIRMGDGHAEVISAMCKGCGTCAAACPSKSIKMAHFTDRELIAEIEGILGRMSEYELA
jgi:heterodisulfide reductase subunit A2